MFVTTWAPISKVLLQLSSYNLTARVVALDLFAVGKRFERFAWKSSIVPCFNEIGPRLYDESAQSNILQGRKASLVVDCRQGTSKQEVELVAGLQGWPIWRSFVRISNGKSISRYILKEIICSLYLECWIRLNLRPILKVLR